jgi:hypothetical protein
MLQQEMIVVVNVEKVVNLIVHVKKEKHVSL